MTSLRQLAAIAGWFSLLGAPALACDSHEEQAGRARPIPGRVAFQPAPPHNPRDGDIWIDARTGAQHLRRGESWVLRAPPHKSHVDVRQGV